MTIRNKFFTPVFKNTPFFKSNFTKQLSLTIIVLFVNSFAGNAQQFCNVSKGTITPEEKIKVSSADYNSTGGYWSFTATVGTTYHFWTTRAVDATQTTSYDPEITIYGPNSTSTLVGYSDDGLGSGNNSYYSFTASSAGTYNVSISQYSACSNQLELVNLYYCTGGSPGTTPLTYIPSIEFIDDNMSTTNAWLKTQGLYTNPTSYCNYFTSTTYSSWANKAWRNVSGETTATYVNIYGTSKKCWLISPLILLPSSNVPNVEYEIAYTDYANSNVPEGYGSDDKIYLLISSDYGASWKILKNYGTGSSISYLGQQESISLSTYAGKKVMFAFYAESATSNNDNDLFVRNFKVQSCPGNQTLNISSSNSSICSGESITLTATPSSGYNPTSYKWYGASSSGGTYSLLSTTTTNTYTGAITSSNRFIKCISYVGTSCDATSNIVTITVNTNSTNPTGATANLATIIIGSSSVLSVSGGSLGTGASWKWYTGSCGGTLAGTGSSISVSPTVNTTYYVRAEGTCNTTSCVSVTVFVTKTITICEGQSVKLTQINGSLGTGASWSWFSGSCGGALAGTGESVNVTPNATTTYYVRASGDCNTTDCASMKVIVKKPPTAPTGITNAGTTICNGGSVTLTATGGVEGDGCTYQWYAGGCGSGSVLGTGSSINLNPTSTTSYYVRRVGTSPCSITTACASGTVTVITTPSQPSAITGTTSICPSVGTAYSVTNVTGVTYNWTYSGTGTISGSGNSISLSATTGGTLSVTASNSCGTSTARTQAITILPGTPSQPSAITGTTSICPSVGTTYSVTNVAGVTYNWTYSGTGTLSGSGNSRSLSATTGGTLSVTASNSCGTSTARTQAITILPGTPSQPSAITGTTSICPSVGTTYSVTNVAGVTYNWTYSGTGTLSGSGNSRSLSATTGGTLSVTASNSCGTSTARTQAITILPGTPSQPSAITGTTSICPSVGTTYSVTNVAGVTYNWTYSGTGTITGSGNSISLSATTNGTLSVTASNSCGTSTARTQAITILPGTPAQPSAITGTTSICPSVGTAYSVTNVAGVTYNWTYSGTGTISGSGNSISLSATTNGTLSVTASNSCGTSTARTQAITILPGTPSQPGVISGTATQCPELTGQVYSISAVTNATTYTWIVPTGWTITAGQGSTSITVSTGTAGQNGNIGVTAGNSCGTGVQKTFQLT